MSINATFYQFNKRKNSTARPSGGTSYSILLKDDCSVLNPSILLATTNPTRFNYVYIPSFDRYYFISDWVSEHNLWRAECSVDVLASWRDSIRNSRQYVLRSASKYNTYISDPLYPGTLKKEYSEHTFAVDEKCFKSSNYTYVIGVMNGVANAPRLGGVTYYALTGNQIQTLMNALLGNADYLGQNGAFPTLFGITKEVMQALVNPTQYIVDSYMLPYSIPYTQSSTLTVGWWTLPGFGETVQCLQLQNQVYRNTFYTQDYVFDHHPQFTRGAYMDGAPFHRMTLSAGPFGDIEIDTNMLVYNTVRLSFEVAGDYLGNVELIVRGEPSNQIITRREATVKVPFKIGQMFQDRIGMLKNTAAQFSSGIGAGLGLVKGDAGGLMSYGDTVLDSFETSIPKYNVVGNNDSLYDVNRSWILQQEFTYCVDDDQSQRGKPLCEDIIISDLSGFCICAEPDVNFACYDSEHDAIAAYMSNGFYIE